MAAALPHDPAGQGEPLLAALHTIRSHSIEYRQSLDSVITSATSTTQSTAGYQDLLEEMHLTHLMLGILDLVIPALEHDSYPVTARDEELLQLVQPVEFAVFEQSRFRKLQKCIRKIGRELESRDPDTPTQAANTACVVQGAKVFKEEGRKEQQEMVERLVNFVSKNVTTTPSASFIETSDLVEAFEAAEKARGVSLGLSKRCLNFLMVGAAQQVLQVDENVVKGSRMRAGKKRKGFYGVKFIA
eukprot:TRINITY_DN80_c0_g1_i1.p1 TRINITY_DN80_c0_g1~~TRINITY_DN80_c0_g1_i1.p1  ORF type:complete len:244 (-),score=18.67 TRINITY_DN80_c0_g1_i1:642-1373(-)